LAARSGALHDLWHGLSAEQWATEVHEPNDNRELGAVTLHDHALLRLTEVEVHGTDMQLGLDPWSNLFVEAALPLRIARLNARRSATQQGGSWLLVAADGPAYRVSISDGEVEAGPARSGEGATAVLEASSRDLLALLLGRPVATAPKITGDVSFGESFQRALPGP
jgi:hypothetical protein